MSLYGTQKLVPDYILCKNVHGQAFGTVTQTGTHNVTVSISVQAKFCGKGNILQWVVSYLCVESCGKIDPPQVVISH